MFKFDLLFEVQVPRPWDDGKERRRFEEAMEQAVFAEKMGFSTIWFVEHHFLTEFAHSSAPEVMLAALSQRTETIRLGHGVTLLLNGVNHPIRVAERAAMLDIVSGGRLEMGTGRSSSPYQVEAFGVDMNSTRQQWEEALHLLPRLWNEEKVVHDGPTYRWDEAITVVPKPLQQPHPPLWVAATQEETCRVAGEHGIGLLMPTLNAPQQMKGRLDAYKQAVADPITPAGEFINDQAALFALTFCHDDEDQARDRGGRAALWYKETITEIYSNDWRGQPLDKVPESYRAHVERRRSGATFGGTMALDMPPITDKEALIDYLIETGAWCVGDPARVLANVRGYRDVGADRLVTIMQMADLSHDDIMHSLELFGSEVIATFRAEEAAVAATAPAVADAR